MMPVSLNPESRAMAMQIEAAFEGANWIEAHTLLSAKTMLDLYGEAIRERAYVVHDPIEGDFVLRPDFTIPVVEAHMRSGGKPARYAYSGRVWRKRKSESTKHSFWQMGLEIFDDGEKSFLDAEVYAIAAKIGKGRDLPVKTGDLGLIFSILDALDISEYRRAALARHVWRPKAFSRLLDRFSKATPKHAHLLKNATLNTDTPVQGKRTREMIEARIDRLRTDLDAEPIEPEVKSSIDSALTVSGSLQTAELRFSEIAGNFSPIAKFADAFSKRNRALENLGVDLNAVAFDAGFGRETMEYYDGFIFEFGSGAISGGRYDGLTACMGDGRAIGAIGMACRLDKLTGESA